MSVDKSGTGRAEPTDEFSIGQKIQKMEELDDQSQGNNIEDEFNNYRELNDYDNSKLFTLEMD